MEGGKCTFMREWRDELQPKKRNKTMHIFHIEE